MKTLIIGGNRFVGLRLSIALDANKQNELHILNRTGQTAFVKNAVLHKGDRSSLKGSFLDKDWDVIYDFAAYSGAHARESLDFFNKVGRYISISTASVYSDRAIRPENAFDAAAWPITDQPTEEEKLNPYQFGKRQVEAVFTQQAPFPVVHVRFPYILGPDDYTHRLSFHYDRVRDGEPIHFPNPNVKFSVVQSEDAANFLLWAGEQKFTGPVNVASPEGIGMDELMTMIETATGQKTFYQAATDDNHSPYGQKADGVLDVNLIKKLGYAPKSWRKWLPELIRELGAPPQKGHLH